MKRTTIRILFIILHVALLGLLYAETTVLSELVKDGTPEAIQEALSAGADVNARDEFGFTALILAAESNENPEVIRVLLEADAYVNARDKNGWTALMSAAWANLNPKVIGLLLNAGADAKAKTNNGKTAWDEVQRNEKLIGTDAYRKLKKATFE